MGRNEDDKIKHNLEEIEEFPSDDGKDYESMSEARRKMNKIKKNNEVDVRI
ncbi:unnamed protein product [Moneuplotes crassus]|uniref:Uncharacterized protein n=1 Tax=Euplotes crassus TaxID=5936 RepID=A0AAD1Y1P7_EUPCR|nr:unnamed protein product [Moneuplotes crassus]